MNRRNFLLLSALSPVIAKDYVYLNNDVYLSKKELRVLKLLNRRLRIIKKMTGFSNFNFISFDETILYGKNYSKVGNFTRDEYILIEKLFYFDSSKLGFYGEKTIAKISNIILQKDIVMIPNSSHYLFKGKSFTDYNRIINDVSDDLILTSGVRNVVKQLSLYLSKVEQLKGNLSKASTIIAPPSHSYHAVSDFDIGIKGWGNKNFTSAFANTPEFYEIRKLDYIGIRYRKNNKDGVRFEPWHVKIS